MKKILLASLLSAILLSWTFQTIELETKQILNDKVEILLPKNFGIMPDDMLQIKYPSANRPTVVYSDENGTVNIAFNHTTSRASQKEIEKYKDVFVSTFKSSYPTAVWGEKGVKEINGRKVGFLEVTTPAIDTKIYNLLFFTDLDGKLLICTFNCTSKKKSAWAESAKKIFNSLTIK
jgi:hypothetical protein